MPEQPSQSCDACGGPPVSELVESDGRNTGRTHLFCETCHITGLGRLLVGESDGLVVRRERTQIRGIARGFNFLHGLIVTAHGGPGPDAAGEPPADSAPPPPGPVARPGGPTFD
jgi:hypothetical protein